MYRHPYFDLLLHGDSELESLTGLKILERITLHEWPLSCVQRLTLDRGRQVIYKSQYGPTVEADVYARARSPLLPWAESRYRAEGHVCMLIEYIDAPMFEDLEPSEADALRVADEVCAGIETMGDDLPAYLDVRDAERWQAYVHALLSELRALIDGGAFSETTTEMAADLARWAALPSVLAAFDGPCGYVHRDLGADNVLVQPDGLRVIDWQRPIWGPTDLDRIDLLNSLGYDPLRHVDAGVFQVWLILAIGWLTEAGILALLRLSPSLLEGLPSAGLCLGRVCPAGLRATDGTGRSRHHGPHPARRGLRPRALLPRLRAGLPGWALDRNQAHTQASPGSTERPVLQRAPSMPEPGRRLGVLGLPDLELDEILELLQGQLAKLDVLCFGWIDFPWLADFNDHVIPVARTDLDRKVRFGMQKHGDLIRLGNCFSRDLDPLALFIPPVAVLGVGHVARIVLAIPDVEPIELTPARGVNADPHAVPTEAFVLVVADAHHKCANAHRSAFPHVKRAIEAGIVRREHGEKVGRKAPAVNLWLSGKLVLLIVFRTMQLARHVLIQGEPVRRPALWNG